MNAADPVLSDTKSRRKTSVLAVDSGRDGFRQVLEVLETMPGVNASTAPADKAVTQARDHAPDIVVLDVTGFGLEEAELVGNLRALSPDLPLIVVSDALDDAQMRRLMKLRVHDWLRHPLSSGDLINAILTGVRVTKQSSNKVHAVVSANGGAGATTVAVLLADLLAQGSDPGRGGVGLFDLDFSTGGCGDLLNTENTFSLDGVLNNPGRVDAEFVSLIQQRHPHGFAIYSFRNPDLVTHLNCYELVLRMLDAVTAQHAHTVLDIPYHETDWRQDVLAEVNTITLVCELNLPSIKQALALCGRFRDIGGRKPQLHVLINKRRRGLFGSQRIAEARIRELFAGVDYGYLPEETDALLEAMDRGIPLSDLNRSSRMLKALARYAGKVLHIEGVKA